MMSRHKVLGVAFAKGILTIALCLILRMKKGKSEGLCDF
jgi:hypothetical protein